MFFQQRYANTYMRSFHLMVNALTNIMQQSGPFGQRHIHAQLCCHQSCQMSHLNGMTQDILAIAGAIF